MSPHDVVFVGGETPKIHQHTGGLVVLDATDRPDFGYDRFRRHIEDRIAQVPQFHWRLHEVPLGLDLPYWVEAHDFSFDHHIRRIAVPAPGDRKALGELVGYLYSHHLDRSRPLWEVWFIEGLGEGHHAFFIKVHHSMMDGEGANKLGALLCSLEPDGECLPVSPSIVGATPGVVPDRWRESLTAAGRLASLPVRAGREMVDGARRAVTKRLGLHGRQPVSGPVPTASFNCDIGCERGFLFGSVGLDDVKTVTSHFGVTVNDVVLALVAGSLRDYLVGREWLPDTALRTSIAVSLRTRDDEDFSNHVTTASVTLATTLTDPIERLEVIAAEAASAKEEARHGVKGALDLMAILPPALVNVALSVAPPALLPRAAGFNLIISNIRGSPVPLYLAGARVAAMYPMSIIMPGGGLNVTCISLVDEIQFGFTIEPAAFPEPWRLVDGLQHALDDYVDLVGQRAGRHR